MNDRLSRVLQDLATVLCSIGMQLCGQDLFSMVASVVGVEDNLTPLTRFITFHDFLAIMATIATVSEIISVNFNAFLVTRERIKC